MVGCRRRFKRKDSFTSRRIDKDEIPQTDTLGDYILSLNGPGETMGKECKRGLGWEKDNVNWPSAWLLSSDEELVCCRQSPADMW